MAEANQAYRDDDENRLREILEEGKKGPTPHSENQDEMDRIDQMIAQVVKRLQQIEELMSALQSTEIGQLKLAYEEAKLGGRDLLSDLALTYIEQIDAARRYVFAALDILNSAQDH